MGQARHGCATHCYPAGDLQRQICREGTHAIRAAIQRSTARQGIAQRWRERGALTAALSRELGINVKTVAKWRTDNGVQFAEQPRNRNAIYSRPMRFDMICETNGIEHRLTKPNHPRTNVQFGGGHNLGVLS
ncbi:hypothetical protein SAMN05216236_1525 [Sedimentitalea nanhaiensis]|uniref:Homeodomain-like domain-containing protein n=1 Tax=Sedimentitalea nanhaiensis TaxID=999627 RepID=A0A1I7E9A2_9RHOB|nr:hypothetical protein SAMN05216236_1525 [Sedimentitalea nanhaiensis]